MNKVKELGYDTWLMYIGFGDLNASARARFPAWEFAFSFFCSGFIALVSSNYTQKFIVMFKLWLINTRPDDWAVTKTLVTTAHIPRGLVVRTRRSHRRLGSIPGVGICFFAPFVFFRALVSSNYLSRQIFHEKCSFRASGSETHVQGVNNKTKFKTATNYENWTKPIHILIANQWVVSCTL